MQDEPIKSPPPDAGSSSPVISGPTKSPLVGKPRFDSTPDADGADIATNPPWASDLRQLYNAVVEEPLPDSFINLLSQLDSED